MASSTFKNLLTLKEMPFPSLLILTDAPNAVSAENVMQILLDKFLAQTNFSVHFVQANPFTHKFSFSDQVCLYTQSFNAYGEDETALDKFITFFRSSCQIKSAPSIPRLTHLAAKTPLLSTAAPLGLENLKNCIDSKVKTHEDDNKKTVLMIDRAEDVLLHTTVRHLLSLCKEIAAAGSIVVLACSSSLISANAMKNLRHSASAIVDLSPAEAVQTPQWQGIADVLIRRSTGKIIKTREYYCINSKTSVILTAIAPPRLNDDYSFINTLETPTKLAGISVGDRFKTPHGDSSQVSSHRESNVKSFPHIPANKTIQQKAATHSTEVQSKDDSAINVLASQTTFNLKLSDHERTVKNNLVLPHQRVVLSGMEGMVHYTPDSEDWDDEDPDDDLDI
ncbi:uncharacterized protein LOC108669421 [Hyalella azteca]|uniref:Elongator complex protein 5 n=1 Tax=Hyalella azteca TaxID=294128 RepID=A0A8B7NF49_HYAAZ|nr:uncharacterized protein LOC108669421 [Hyalella azteca]